MSDPSSAAAVGLSVKLLEMVAPKGIARLSTWFRGVEVLVLGQPRAGKTTFIDYLRHGVLDGPDAFEKTLKKEVSPMFAIRMGRSAGLELHVKRAVDIPGQIGAIEHANLAFERNPHGIVLFLDSTKPIKGKPDRGSLAWLDEFVEQFEDLWSVKGKRKKNRLKSLTVVFNKVDKDAHNKLEKNRSKFRSVLRRLTHSKGSRVKRIRIMPCIAINNSEGTKFIDAIITSIAKDIVS